jgi:hypothetical protein
MTGAPVWTAVDLEYCAEEVNYRLIFGTPGRRDLHEKSFGLTRQTAWFRNGSVFGLDLWEGGLIANRAGERRTRTRARACFVLQAGVPGEELTRIQQVRPGAHILIQTRGVRRSQFLLAWLEELAMRCDLTSLDAQFFLDKSLAVTTLVPEREPPSRIGFPRHAVAH